MMRLRRYFTPKRLTVLALVMLLTLNLVIQAVPMATFRGASAAGEEAAAPVLVGSWTELKAATAAEVQLSGDLTADSTFAIAAAGLTIDGNGFKILRNGYVGALFSVANDNTLTLKNITVDGNFKANATVADAPLVVVGDGDKSGTLVLEGALLCNNFNEVTTEDAAKGKLLGGAVRLQKGTVSGTGSIEGNAASEGAGIYVASGSNTLSGGKLVIRDNQAVSSGGGVCIGGGTLLVKAPVAGDSVVVTENKTTANDSVGGGVYLAPAATLTLGDKNVTQGSNLITIAGNKNKTAIDNLYPAAGATVKVEALLNPAGTVGIGGSGTTLAAADSAPHAANAASVFVPDAVSRAIKQDDTDNKLIVLGDAATYRNLTVSVMNGALCSVYPAGEFRVAEGGKLEVMAETTAKQATLAATSATGCTAVDSTLHNPAVSTDSKTGCVNRRYEAIAPTANGATAVYGTSDVYKQRTVPSSDAAHFATATGDYLHESLAFTAADPSSTELEKINTCVGTKATSEYGSDYQNVFVKQLAQDSPASTILPYLDDMTLRLNAGAEHNGEKLAVYSCAPQGAGYTAEKLDAYRVENGIISIDLTQDENVFGNTLVAILPKVARTGSGENAHTFTTVKDAVDSLTEGGTVYLLCSSFVDETIDIDNNIILRPASDAGTYSLIRGNHMKDTLLNVADGKKLSLYNVNVDGNAPTTAEEALITAGSGSTVELAGRVQIRNNANTAEDGKGGGVYLKGAALTTAQVACLDNANGYYINNIEILQNSAKNGAGIYCETAGAGDAARNAAIEGIAGCINVHGNVAKANGGGVYADKPDMGGLVVITGNSKASTGGEQTPNNLYLANDTSGVNGVITVTKSLDPSSSIGLTNPQANNAVFARAGTGVTFAGNEKNFFCDTLNYYPIENNTHDQLSLIGSGTEKYKYTINVSVSGAGGMALPGGKIRVRDSQKLTIVPDAGYMIDDVVLSNTSTSGRSIRDNVAINNYVGTVILGAKDEAGYGKLKENDVNDIVVTFKPIDSTLQYTVSAVQHSTSAAGGGTLVVGNGTEEDKNAAEGSSKTVTLKPGEEYDVTAATVGATNVFGQLQRVQNTNDYTYTFNDIQSDKTLTATFTKVYEKRELKNSAVTAVKANGDLVHTGAALSAKVITGDNGDANKASYAKLKAEAEKDKRKLGTAYELSLNLSGASSGKDPFRRTIDLTFTLDKSYANKKCWVYHIKSDNTIEKKEGTVDANGDLKVTGFTELSPFATVLPGITAITPQNVTTTVGTAPALPKTVSVTYSDNTTGTETVLWDSISADQYASERQFDVYGTVPGTTLRAKCTVKVEKAAGSGGDNDKVTTSPKSGDNVRLLTIMIAVFAVSIVLFIVMAVVRRRKK